MRESLDIQSVLVVVVVVAAPEIWAESRSMGICRTSSDHRFTVLFAYILSNQDSKNVKPQKQEHPKRANSWRKNPHRPISSHLIPPQAHLITP